ncbi:MAG: hypothetical protein WED00_10400 [Aquisalimonadaceae bacterium]
MYTELMIAASRQWTLGSMAMYRLNGLFIDHVTRLTFLQVEASTAYMQLSADHLGSFRHLDDPNALLTQLQRHHQALEKVSRRFSTETASLSANLQRTLADELSADARENVICFTSAVQQRARREPS